MHTAVWTGSKMIVWGGAGLFWSYLQLGAVGTTPGRELCWTPTSTTNAPLPRSYSYSRLDRQRNDCVGWIGRFIELDTAGKHNPSSTLVRRHLHRRLFPILIPGRDTIPDIDSWTATSLQPTHPAGRAYHTAVWTGSEMIVWGGLDEQFRPGVATPVRDTIPMQMAVDGLQTPKNAPMADHVHTAVWSGH